MHNKILKYIFAAENLLLIWVVMLPLLSSAIVVDTAVDVHWHDDFDMLPLLHELYYIIVVGISISYIVHMILRITEKRQNMICAGHISAAVLLSGIIIFDFYTHVPVKAPDADVHPAIDRYFSISQNIWLQLFILVQVLFIIYGTVRMIRAKK